MMKKEEMSLEEIIKTTRNQNKNKGGKGTTFKPKPNITKQGKVVKKNVHSPATFKKKLQNPKWQMAFNKMHQNLGEFKITVSNLHSKVSDRDIKDLFSEFGPIKSSAVHYNQQGVSLKSAHVIFHTKEAASKAWKTYNGVPLDGIPMRIETSGPQSFGQLERKPKALKGNTNGLAPWKVKPSFNGKPNKVGPWKGHKVTEKFSPKKKFVAKKGKGVKKPTADDLDAELDAYNMKRV